MNHARSEVHQSTGRCPAACGWHLGVLERGGKVVVLQTRAAARARPDALGYRDDLVDVPEDELAQDDLQDVGAYTHRGTPACAAGNQNVAVIDAVCVLTPVEK